MCIVKSHLALFGINYSDGDCKGGVWMVHRFGVESVGKIISGLWWESNIDFPLIILFEPSRCVSLSTERVSSVKTKLIYCKL
jgi:hypothetical protein